jgi:DNA-binding response OmpR family regulator
MPGAHLFLVEDDDVLRELILRNLQARGYDVRVAADLSLSIISFAGMREMILLLVVWGSVARSSCS